MTIDQFRAHPEWVQQWTRELETNSILRLVLQVMEENHPARFTIQGDDGGDLSPTRAAVELGMTRGYSKYGDTLKLLAKQKIEPVHLGEPTYDEPPKEEITHG